MLCLKLHKVRRFHLRCSKPSMNEFMLPKNLSIRRQKTICQCLPEEYEEKLHSFQKFIIKMCWEHGYIFSQIVNVDQTSVWFDISGNMTVETKGRRAPTFTSRVLKDSGAMWWFVSPRMDKNFRLAMFLEKTMYHRLSNSLTAYLSEYKKKDGWLMIWSRTRWSSFGRSGTQSRHTIPSCLESPLETSENVWELLCVSEISVGVIPGGMTGMLQPLNASVTGLSSVDFVTCTPSGWP